jgi:hypothetical protein
MLNETHFQIGAEYQHKNLKCCAKSTPRKKSHIIIYIIIL